MASSQPGKALHNPADRRKRRYPRFRSEFPVTLTILAGSEYQTINGHCKDISEAGMGILIASELMLGEVVSLKFCLPKAPESWEIRAVLRHRRGYHYGFEFLTIPAHYTKSVRTYMQSLDRAD